MPRRWRYSNPFNSVRLILKSSFQTKAIGTPTHVVYRLRFTRIQFNIENKVVNDSLSKVRKAFYTTSSLMANKVHEKNDTNKSCRSLISYEVFFYIIFPQNQPFLTFLSLKSLLQNALVIKNFNHFATGYSLLCTLDRF